MGGRKEEKMKRIKRESKTTFLDAHLRITGFVLPCFLSLAIGFETSGLSQELFLFI